MVKSTTASNSRPWLALVGPTCSGKTWFAEELLRHFPLELVNLDSFQVYSHFRVGTGRADQGLAPAHLYGFVDPHDRLPAHQYVELARKAVAGIVRRGHRPLFEGGSISYLRELVRVHPVCLLGIRPPAGAGSADLIMKRLGSHPFETLIDEVRQGLQLGYRNSQVLADDVVYLPAVEYVDGRAGLAETLERMRSNLIRRQQTQMREYEQFDIRWFPSSRASLPALHHAVGTALNA